MRTHPLAGFSFFRKPSCRVGGSPDGEVVRPLRGDYNLITVALRPGRHDVHFRYLPLSVIGGGAVSAATIIALLVGLWHSPRRAGISPARRSSRAV